MYEKQAIAQLVGEVLDGTELGLQVDAYSLEENLESGDVKVRCEVHNSRTGEHKTIDGRGVGIVDAFFSGIVALYSDEFPSLGTIRCMDFSVVSNVGTGRGRSGTDMTARVSMMVANSEGREFLFVDESPSITRSSIYAVLRGVEFFINSERAFIAVFRALEHSRKQGRSDSAERYTSMLSTLVEATSYSEVIAQIRKTELGS